jgi:tRNA/rRNA methyltransferase
LVVVLVRPQLAQNIGFCARAMGNFALHELRLVAPRDGWPNAAAEAPASGATWILEQAQVFDSLEDAVADCQLVAATTARDRGLSLPFATPAQLPVMAQERGSAKTAVLFGPEASGLSNEDLAVANALIRVPLNPEFSSLNLAQAVLLLAYEWFQARSDTPALPSSPQGPADRQAVDNLMKRLVAMLEDSRFFGVEDKRATVEANLYALFGKAQLSPGEVGMLHGLFKALHESGRRP